jgi:predicted TPR repeat methyltransferase
VIRPDLLQDLHDMPSEDLRQLIAHAAGIHAHRDADGGGLMAQALRRIADRLTGAARRVSA